MHKGLGLDTPHDGVVALHYSSSGRLTDRRTHARTHAWTDRRAHKTADKSGFHHKDRRTISYPRKRAAFAGKARTRAAFKPAYK